MTAAATFAVVSAALAAGHQAGDYWVQTNGQALAKGGPGGPGGGPARPTWPPTP